MCNGHLHITCIIVSLVCISLDVLIARSSWHSLSFYWCRTLGIGHHYLFTCRRHKYKVQCISHLKSGCVSEFYIDTVTVSTCNLKFLLCRPNTIICGALPTQILVKGDQWDYTSARKCVNRNYIRSSTELLGIPCARHESRASCRKRDECCGDPVAVLECRYGGSVILNRVPAIYWRPSDSN